MMKKKGVWNLKATTRPTQAIRKARSHESKLPTIPFATQLITNEQRDNQELGTPAVACFIPLFIIGSMDFCPITDLYTVYLTQYTRLIIPFSRDSGIASGKTFHFYLSLCTLSRRILLWHSVYLFWQKFSSFVTLSTIYLFWYIAGKVTVLLLIRLTYLFLRLLYLLLQTLQTIWDEYRTLTQLYYEFTDLCKSSGSTTCQLPTIKDEIASVFVSYISVGHTPCKKIKGIHLSEVSKKDYI
jgi:hypothetical protein